MKRILTILLLIHAAFAGDTLFVSLEEAILIAFENNAAIGIERLGPKIAKTYVRAEGAAFEPELTGSATMTESETPFSYGSSEETSLQISKGQSFQGSLGFALPTGTTISAEASISGDLPESSLEQWSSEIGVSVNQSLLQGISPVSNLARLRKAKIDVEISELELKALGESVIAEVEGAYWGLYLAVKELEIRERSLTLARTQLLESEERIKVGKLAEIELAAVHAEVATREAAMIDARAREEQARLKLIYLLNPGAENEWELFIVPTESPVVPQDTVDGIALHESLAIMYRPDLNQARLSLRKNRLDLARTRNGLLPKLDLFIELGRTSYAGSFEDATPDLDSPYYKAKGGLSLELPLTLRQARAEHARTRWTREQLQLALENMERLVERDVRIAYSEVFRSGRQIEATEVANRLQEKKLEAEQEKFRIGKSTNFQVLQAQRDFIESQLGQARARAVYLEALSSLYLMEGTLLERRGIAAN